MAKTTIKRQGYGQVEPNHLAKQATKEIYAQLPCNSQIKQLENGQFAKYDMEKGEVNFTGDGEWLMVFNEVKLYDDRYQGYKDFAYIKTDFVDEEMTPRLMATTIYDHYTTNMVGDANTGNRDVYDGIDLEVGDVLSPNEKGILVAEGGDPTMQWKVVKVYTMPDGQPGVKLQRIK